MGSQLAHAYDAEPASRAVRGLIPGDGERRFKRGVCEIRECLADSRLNIIRMLRRGIDRDDGSELTTVSGTQAVGSLSQRQG